MARDLQQSTSSSDVREAGRMTALEQLDFLDTPRDGGFERIARLIQGVFESDYAAITLFDGHRQWYKASTGILIDELPARDSLCHYVIQNDEAFVVEDAANVPAVAQHPGVTGPTKIRFYAGVPLRTKAGQTIGTVCAASRTARAFNCRDLTILQDFACAAMDRIELQHSAATDSLTAAMTRRAFKVEAEQLISSALRHGYEVSCVVLDIDHFKAVNDTYGHAVGDDVLKAISEACRAALRAGDLFGRLGGEEFAMLLPHTNQDGALVAAEKIRARIAATVIEGDFGCLSVTASLGVSMLSTGTHLIDTLLVQADCAMYRAKQSGRNRCIAWNSLPEQISEDRRRVLKAAYILCDRGGATIECTINSLSLDSAGISVLRSVEVPDEFVIVFKDDGEKVRCRVVARNAHHLEVLFERDRT